MSIEKRNTEEPEWIDIDLANGQYVQAKTRLIETQIAIMRTEAEDTHRRAKYSMLPDLGKAVMWLALAGLFIKLAFVAS